jgi:hypothetical protein
LLITIVGAAAALLIVRASNITTTVTVFGAEQVLYSY